MLNKKTTTPTCDGKTVNLATLFPIAAMAALNVAPDETFSETERLAWEIIHCAIKLTKMEGSTNV